MPTLEQEWIQFDDPIDQFRKVLEGVGGECILVSSPEEIDEHLSRHTQFESAKIRTSTVEGIGRPSLDLASINDPHDLQSVDFAVLSGDFAVAENGAVWVTDRTMNHRVLYFIAQHMALVVPVSQVVQNMHEAYQRLTFDQRRFGTFISGPSKTADIEQSLVIGAHGPRSHIVFLIQDNL